MSRITFHVAGALKEEMARHGLGKLKDVWVDKDSYEHFLKSINSGGYENLTQEQREALAVGCCYSHPNHKDKHLEPLVHPIKKFSARLASNVTESEQWSIFGTWAFRALVIIFLVLIFAFSAHCQGTSQIDVITFQDNSNATIKSFAAPFKIKCGFGMVCTASGSVLTMTPPAGGSVTINTTAPLGGGGTGTSFTLTCTGCLTSVTAHNLLSATHGDTTTGTVARGDVITGQGASPTWARLAKGLASQCLQMDGTATDVVWGPCAAGGAGTVTSFSAGTLSPLFTTSVATATTTPALSFSLSNAAANTVFGNNTSGSAAPGFQALVKGQQVATTMYTDANQTMSAGTLIDGDKVIFAQWNAAPIFYADDPKFAGATQCDSIANVIASAAYIASSRAIINAEGFFGDQNCPVNMLATTRPTWIKLGAENLHVTVNQPAGFPTTSILAAPSAPTSASTTTTGGTLSNAVFVRVGLMTPWMAENNTLGPSPELTVTMNAACSGTPTCTATINSPAVAVGAYAYNLYESNTTGTEKLCNVAPIPLGESFTIKANCTGAAVNTANLAFEGRSILSGMGDLTKISLENAAASIDGSGTWNWDFKDFALMSTLTTQSVNGMLMLGNAQRADNLTFLGGGNHIYITGNMVTVGSNRHYGFTQTTGPVAGIASFNTSWLKIKDPIFSNFTFPVSPTLNNGIQLNQCTMCIVDGMRAQNIDNSQAVNGGSMMAATGDGSAAGASSNVQFINFQADGLININCADFLNFTHDSTMNTGTCANTNNRAGVGSNVLGADGFDIFMAANVTLTALKGYHRGGPGGACCPTLEIYSSTNVTVNGGDFSRDQSNEGVRVVSSPATTFNGVITSGNTNSGVVLADATSTVTCNGTANVVWVSGLPFGPWTFNQQAWIGGVPTAFNIDHVVDFHNLVLTTTCGLGASQAFVVYTQDFSSTGFKADDNGQAGTGAGVRTGLAEAYYFSGHSQGSLSNGSCNDNAPVAGSKHQQYCVRLENNARGRFTAIDMTNNGGGSNCLLEGNNVAGNHTYCDSTKNSAFFLDDNATPMWTASAQQTIGANNKVGQADIVADSGAINTTETIIVKTATLPANRLIAGTHIRATLTGTCTSSAANTTTITGRMGTNGTTADTAIFTAVMGAAATTGTAIPFWLTVDCTVRTVGASGTGFCTVKLENNGVTGISTSTLQIVMPTMSAFNTTTAGNILSFSDKSAGTTTTSTFKQGVIEFVYQ
jgi:hypothetical protein